MKRGRDAQEPVSQTSRIYKKLSKWFTGIKILIGVKQQNMQNLQKVDLK